MSLFISADHSSMPLQLPPLSLYIHFPWCVRKCPYCDFNSHSYEGELPIKEYVLALISDLQMDSPLAQQRKISSIFFGGGTPSLVPASAIGEVLEAVDKHLGIEDKAEITLEANPGTTEYLSFDELRSAGVNRLSLGVQSFNDHSLKSLGRIHNSANIMEAYDAARKGGFENINLDLMHGLPNQTVSEANRDIQMALKLEPEHISWYQLTVEPNTEFYSRPPKLPPEDLLVDILDAGHQSLSSAGYTQYETSAYARPGKTSKHNYNYWEFGDYLALGAGAHGKITFQKESQIIRYQKTRLPRHYLDTQRPFTCAQNEISPEALPLEFFMNALRLKEGVKSGLFYERTGIVLEDIQDSLNTCIAKGMLMPIEGRIQTSARGYRFLNSVLETFVT